MYRKLVAGLGALALVVAGCGDEEKESTSSGDSLTKTEYIAKADEICAAAKKVTDRANKQIDALPANARVQDGVPAIASALEASRNAARRLQALPEPGEDKATLDAYLANIDKTNAAGARLEAAARAGDLAKVEQFGKSDNLRAKSKRLATQYGFKRCSRGK